MTHSIMNVSIPSDECVCCCCLCNYKQRKKPYRTTRIYPSHKIAHTQREKQRQRQRRTLLTQTPTCSDLNLIWNIIVVQNVMQSMTLISISKKINEECQWIENEPFSRRQPSSFRSKSEEILSLFSHSSLEHTYSYTNIKTQKQPHSVNAHPFSSISIEFLIIPLCGELSSILVAFVANIDAAASIRAVVVSCFFWDILR